MLSSRRFKVVEKLGEGGMGAVYEVVDQERQARMALKTLLHLSPEGVERFKREFRSLQDLHHPNLISLGELVEEEGRWFFTMELVRGRHFLEYVQPEGAEALALAAPVSGDAQTLVTEGRAASASGARVCSAPADEGAQTVDTLVLNHEPAASTRALPPAPSPGQKAWRFDEARLRTALGQLARGLHALHRADKVHLDIKPSNILVTEQGRVVLLDFGVLSDVSELRERQGSVVGTPSYMAPEQAGGAPPSPEADWYSVGVLLYRCLTGSLPFTGGALEVMQVKRRVDPVPPQQRVDGLPEELCSLCMELLRRDPTQRPLGREVLRRLGVDVEGAQSTVMLPFVGRQQQLAALHDALSDSRQGPSVAVLVEGESGMGKSRLVRRFLEEVRAQHPRALVLSGRCYERESVPYKGVDGLVEGLASHLSELGEAAVQALQLGDMGPLSHLFPVLQRVPGLAAASPATPVGDPLELRVQAFASLRELLSRLAHGAAPVLLSVDDVQWADQDALVLLNEVLRAPGLLLVATLRLSTTSHGTAPAPEPPELLRLRHRARSVPIQGLPPEASRDLVERLLGADALRDPERVHRIAEESGGQPLFIDALVRYQHTAGPDDPPLKLEQALWARTQYLDPSERQLLELLTVADAPLTQAVAALATSFDFAEYSKQASALRSAHLALTTGPARGDTIEVVHDRIRRAVARHLEAEPRRQWHSRLAWALEEQGQGAAETLARHWREAGRVERAVSYYLRAAQEAGGALAFSREASLYATALELGTFEPTERRRHQTSCAEAFSHAGRVTQAATAFLEAAQGAPEDEAHALRRRAAEQYLIGGKEEQGLQLLSQVLAEVGLRMPHSTGAQIASVVWQRALMSMSSLRPRPRSSQPLSPELARRLEACWVASTTSAYVKPLIAFYFHSHHLRLALKSGDWEHTLRALASEAVTLAYFGRRNHPRLVRLLSDLEPLVAQGSADPLTQSHLSFVRMAEPLCLGDLAQNRPHVEACLHQMQQLGRETWLRSFVWIQLSEILHTTGELREMNHRLQQPRAAAREAGSIYLVMNMQSGSSTSGWLALDEPREARAQVEETRAWWPVLHIPQLRGLLYADLYEGRSREVLQQLEQHMARMVRETPVALVRCIFYDIRSRALLMEAGRQGGTEARSLLRAAAADARRLEREGLVFAQVQAALMRAGVARQQGQLEQALAGYGRAAEQAQDKGLHLLAAAARWRRGELLGGVEGAAQVLRAREWMRQQDFRAPEAMLAMVAPAPARTS